MPVEFACRDIGNQNCGFKAEANTPEELITKVNQHVRSAHGINPTDAQERVERAIKEKESWQESSSLMGETGSTVPRPIETTSGWNQPPATEQEAPGGPGSTFQSGNQSPSQPGRESQRFGQQQGEQYRQTGQEESTEHEYAGQTGTQSQMETDTAGTIYGSQTQRARGIIENNQTREDEEVEK